MADLSNLLGRRPDTPRDPRDYPARPALRALTAMGLAVPASEAPPSMIWRGGPVLDQSQTPEDEEQDHPYCTGFAYTGAALGAPLRRRIADPIRFALAAYAGAQQNDEWPGPPPYYGGSSGRGVLQWATSQGQVSEYHACENADVARDFVRRAGGLLLGLDWSESMFTPNELGFVEFDPASIAGGHEVYARGYEAQLDAFLVQNSWGTQWGRVRRRPGHFWLRRSTLQTMLERGGDCYALTEVRVHKA